MKMALLKTHYSPEEAYSVLMLLDELRDAIWNNYRHEIVEYCRQNTEKDQHSFSEINDDRIPF